MMVIFFLLLLAIWVMEPSADQSDSIVHKERQNNINVTLREKANIVTTVERHIATEMEKPSKTSIDNKTADTNAPSESIASLRERYLETQNRAYLLKLIARLKSYPVEERYRIMRELYDDTQRYELLERVIHYGIDANEYEELLTLIDEAERAEAFETKRLGLASMYQWVGELYIDYLHANGEDEVLQQFLKSYAARYKNRPDYLRMLRHKIKRLEINATIDEAVELF